jgi:hypothetical protein
MKNIDIDVIIFILKNETFLKEKTNPQATNELTKVGKRTKHYGSIISISKNKIVHEFLCLKSPVTKELNCIKGSFKNFT